MNVQKTDTDQAKLQKAGLVRSCGDTKANQKGRKEQITTSEFSVAELKIAHLRDLISNFQAVERSVALDRFYLLRRRHLIRPEHRETLILWLFAISFKGFDEVFSIQLAQLVSLVDQYLSKEGDLIIKAKDLQVIGLASIVILADIETQSKKGVKQMVSQVLDQVQFNFPRPVVHYWADRIKSVVFQGKKVDTELLSATSLTMFEEVARCLDLSQPAFHFGCMILEEAMISSSFLRFHPSVIGFSCACLVSEFCEGQSVLSLVTSLKTLFNPAEIELCAKLLAELTEPGNSYSLVEEKYHQKQYLGVGKFYLTPPQAEVRKRSVSLQ